MKRSELDVRATAYHEARHAVVAQHEGIRIRSASIMPTDGTPGHVVSKPLLEGVQLDATREGAHRARAERHARVSLAGEIAQQRYDRNSVRRWHGDTDRHNAVEIMSHFTQSNRELAAWLRLLEIQTEQILKLRWPFVRALAKELLLRKKIGAKKVAEFLTSIR